MWILIQILGNFIEEILLRGLLASITVILGTPFVLIGAAFDAGNYFSNVSRRYGTVARWLLAARVPELLRLP